MIPSAILPARLNTIRANGANTLHPLLYYNINYAPVASSSLVEGKRSSSDLNKFMVLYTVNSQEFSHFHCTVACDRCTANVFMRFFPLNSTCSGTGFLCTSLFLFCSSTCETRIGFECTKNVFCSTPK